jgi:prophage regulatory protein
MLKIIRKHKSYDLTGMGKTMTDDKVDDGLYVEFFNVGGRAKGIFEHEINAISAVIAAGKSDDEIRDLVKRLMAKRQELANEHLEVA